MRYVYGFDESDGGGRELLGGKGVGLAEMTELGIPVPAGFTITTEACRASTAQDGDLPDGLMDWAAWRSGRASDSVTRSTRCSCPYAPAPRSRCPG